MTASPRHVYLALNKPRGYACSHATREAPIIDSLLPEALRGIGLQAVGRLDRDTSGLLILTTDGPLIHRLGQPGSGVEKAYRVGYRGVLPVDAVERFSAGLRLEGFAQPTRAARLVIESAGRFGSANAGERLGQATVVLHEGRHHQIKRMFRALRTKVVTLHRERIGGYVLPPDLAPGAVAPLDPTALGLSASA